MDTRHFVGAVLLGAAVSVATPLVAYGAGTGGIEHFTLVNSSPSGPGSIFASGVFNAGGTNYPGGKTDEAVFADGTFKIHHGGVKTTFQFNPKTCIGHATGGGPYTIGNGYGRYAHIKGSGTAHVRITIEAGRNPNGTCNNSITAYSLVVHASGPLTF